MLNDNIEENLLGYILKNPKLIDNLEIKPKYLENNVYRKILEKFIECYKLKGCLISSYLDDVIEDVAIIEEDVLYSATLETIQFKEFQKIILDRFKKRFIEDLHNKLQKKEIEYSEYIKKIEKTNKINISGTKENAIININEIKEENKQIERIKSNIELFDKKVKGFALGELSVWSGSNASAKSTFLNQMAIESINQEYKVAIYSGELTPDRLLKWIIMQCAGKKNMIHNTR